MQSNNDEFLCSRNSLIALQLSVILTFERSKNI